MNVGLTMILISVPHYRYAFYRRTDGHSWENYFSGYVPAGLLSQTELGLDSQNTNEAPPQTDELYFRRV
jgi:hypothetical protein